MPNAVAALRSIPWIPLGMVAALLGALASWRLPRPGLLRGLALAVAALIGVAALLASRALACSALDVLAAPPVYLALAVSLAGLPLAWRRPTRAGGYLVLLAILLGLQLLAPAAPCLSASPRWGALAQGAQLLGASLLSLALAGAWGANGLLPEPASARALGLGLGWLLLATLLWALMAQAAWGSYWSWDPLETWRLLALLVTAAAWWTWAQLSWRSPEARLALAAAALLVLWVTIGLGLWLEALRVSSLYLAG